MQKASLQVQQEMKEKRELQELVHGQRVEAEAPQEKRGRTKSRAAEDHNRSSSKNLEFTAPQPLVLEEQVTKDLLPHSWRATLAEHELRVKRGRIIRDLAVWRLDMSSYEWEVEQWREQKKMDSNMTMAVPTPPVYPPHVPSKEELVEIILMFREERDSDNPFKPKIVITRGLSVLEASSGPLADGKAGDEAAFQALMRAKLASSAGRPRAQACQSSALMDEVKQVMLLPPESDPATNLPEKDAADIVFFDHR
ncbi:unnamed protein product [Polarella glacialis]|uniref:Uncharacterized protein n=1 Tax=Polarella glacialis TaxID=89957 RepID=A0A813D4Y1_POLGL|nr:unnamed protein product [Polarella glacialis]